jgi:hypothetical protein
MRHRPANSPSGGAPANGSALKAHSAAELHALVTLSDLDFGDVKLASIHPGGHARDPLE